MPRDTTTRVVRLACMLLFVFFAAKSSPVWGQQAEVEHAASDAYWAQKAQAYPAFEVDLASLRVAELNELNALGQWGPVLDWPHIPVSAAHLPDGRILTWASNQEEGFPAGPEFTYAAAWDPIDGSFKMVPHTSHDMFCAHQVMLEDGRLLVMGGRNTVSLTSIFDPDTDTWVPQEAMDRGRWYPTAVAMPDGDVMVAVGSGGGSYPEVWNDASGWRTLSNVNLNAPILNYTGFYENNWWPLLHVAPNGEVFHSGPTPDMHYINTGGTGSIAKTGPQITGWYPKHGATVMYEEGRLLVAGGAVSGSNQASTNRAMTIDITGGTPVMTEIASMAYARKFQNGVMLPTGEVIIIGGNTSGQKFSDNGTVLAAEMWNPETGQWTTLADMSVPRNYHSVALLMTDGRVWSGGGGLCGSGCAANHVDAQVFSPPYLFNPDGTPASRPVINSAPATVRNGAEMSVNATPGLAKFSLIKMSSTTHGVNSDVRFLSVPFAENGAGSYSLSIHENVNVLTPGQWMLFGIDAAGVPSEAAIVHVSTEGVPQVTNPGTQVMPEGETVSLFIQAADDDPLSFSASGLPANLSIDSATGEISGTIAAGAAGTYDVEVTVTDAVGDVSIVFNWIVTTGATGTILREWWTGISGNEIGLLTGNSNYPDNPSGSDYLTSFEAPADWADNYGTRVRGYIHPPTSGDYTFWISTDDFGELWLSSDDNSANATRIAHVPGWANDYDWYKFPEQQSASISLTAGQRYYIEVLQKEGGGLDNLAVAWQMPGGSLEIIAGGFLSPFSFNDPPTIAAVADQNGAEGEAVSLVVSASDPDGDVLTFSAAGLPAGVTIDPSTGLISGGFVAGSAGVASVTVTASDGEASASTNFDWMIDPARGSWIDYTDDSSIRLTITSVPQTDIDEKDVVVGDLDNDGWDDVVVVRKEGFMATGARADLLLMNEQGTLVDRTEAFAPGFAAAPTIARDAVIADFDGDGWDDLVIASTFGDQPRYYRNLGKNGGTWLGLANESAARLPALDVGSIQYCGVSVGDVNGDGAPDLYFANYIMDGATKDVLLINDGAGNFTDEGDDRLGELINSTFGVQASIIDIDKDGDQDIVKLSAKHATQPWGDDGIFILYNNGSGQFTDWSTVPSDLAYMFGIGDFDEDGRYDVYVVDDRADYVNRSTGVTTNSNISFSQTVTSWARTAGNGGNLHMGDLDGDGDIDLGVADVDSSFPPCETEAGSLRSFVLLENRDDATGDFIDPFGAADKPWNVNMFDFAFMDIDKDGNLDIFTAECTGYRVFTSTQDPVNPGEPTTLILGDLNLGVAAHDSRTGSGYIMYSAENVHERFAAAPPSAWAADHLVAVVFAGGQWAYDRNKDVLVPFTPHPTDHLLAEIDFGANTVNLLEGVNVEIDDLRAGYISGDLAITPEMWGGSPDVGEFWVQGTSVDIAGTGNNSSPVLATIGDQTNYVNESVTLNLAASDPEGDPLSFSADGLPSGLTLSGSEITGTPTTAGVFNTTITVTDGNGGADNETFAWSIEGGDPTEPITLDLGSLNHGIAAHDPRTGTGYIMYSEQSVHTRFADNPPSAWAADHLIAVVFEGGQWKIDRNKYTLVPFTPLPSDHLLAELDFGANTVTHLVGVNATIGGINAGYVSGDLVVTPEMWGGAPEAGEFYVEGSFVDIPGAAAQSIANGGNSELSTIPSEIIPDVFELDSIYPNPFSLSTTIEYRIPEQSAVKLEVFSITGQRVRVLIDNDGMPAGSWRSIWDGSDEGGRGLAAGVYMIRLRANGETKTSKAVLVR